MSRTKLVELKKDISRAERNLASARSNYGQADRYTDECEEALYHLQIDYDLAIQVMAAEQAYEDKGEK